MEEEGKKTKARIVEKLGDISKLALQIEQELRAMPHHNGTFQCTLKPGSGMYIIHTSRGFEALYQYKEGEWYQIEVHKL